MEKVAVLAITKNGIEMGLSLKKSFPDWQIFAPSKFSDGNDMIKWYDVSTSIKIVDMVRNAGAKEVHMRISSPPTTHSCFYGIDTPEKEELLAGRHNVNEMANLINVDTLAFISIDGLYRAVGFQDRNNDTPQFCDACFSGDYPIALPDRDNSMQQNLLSLLDEQV